MRRQFWTLNKLLVLVVLGGFMSLLIEIRYAHRHVLGEHPISWTPLVYSGVMLAGSTAALAFWERGGRLALQIGFALALIVGALGFWHHNGGHLLAGPARELAAWTQPIESGAHHHQEGAKPDAVPQEKQPPAPDHSEGAAGKADSSDTSDGKDKHSAMNNSDHAHGDETTPNMPPALAPLAFAGLGLIGLLACARRFQPQYPEAG